MIIGALIVSAGLSSRMKAFKPMLELCGSTIVKQLIKTFQNANITEIVIISGHQAQQLEEHLAEEQVTIIRNKQYAETDMFYSATLGIKYLSHRCDALFFTPVDIPLFTPATLLSMCVHLSNSNCDILSPSYQQKKGHPMLMLSTAARKVILYQGDQGLRGAIREFQGNKNTLELPDIGTIIDADYPEDYEQLKIIAKDLEGGRQFNSRAWRE